MIGLIFVGDINDCPYMGHYIKKLQQFNIEYKVLFWNRKGIEYLNNNYIGYNYKTSYREMKIIKLVQFVGFSTWVNRKIDELGFDKLILLSTLSGMIINKKNINKYKGKMLFEVRDYSYEHILPFKLKEKVIMESAFLTVISSEGFLSFLPKTDNYVICHNLSNDEEFINYINRDTNHINIVWNGVIRYYSNQINLIKGIANNKRITLSYYGDGPDKERLESFCINNRINNVKFYGRYYKNQKKEILVKSNIIHNNYGDKPKSELKYAISNKYYDSIIYGILQIVEPNTLKSNLVEKHNLGFSVDLRKEFLEKLIILFDNFDYEVFDQNRKFLYDKYIRENEYYYNKIEKFIIGSDLN